jgi:oligopeptide/dipeptide ABC transporter ATP-binding protein
MSPRPLLHLEHVSKLYPVSGGNLHAVDDVSFSIAPGEAVGLVGESGCGKSTLTSLITRLADVTSGHILFHGAHIGDIAAADFARRPERALIQKVFQDPTDSLNPRMSVADSIAEPARLLRGLTDRARLRARVEELAGLVALPVALLDRFPHQLSGGQRARVGIARALASEPALLILDEPTAALDVSVQAVVLKLLADLRRRLGVTYLFVSHDLHVVRLLCSRVLVMYLGQIVEEGDAETIFRQPQHPYTRALLSASPGGHHGPRTILTGEARSPVNPDPHACRFYGRCPVGKTECGQKAPVLAKTTAGSTAACHFAGAGAEPAKAGITEGTER